MQVPWAVTHRESPAQRAPDLKWRSARVKQGSRVRGFLALWRRKTLVVVGKEHSSQARTLDTLRPYCLRLFSLTPLLQPLLSHLWRDECNSSTRVHWCFRRSRVFEDAFLAFIRSKLQVSRGHLPGLVPSPAPATSECLCPFLQ